MLRKRLFFVFALVLVVSMVLTACGPKTEAPATEAPATEAPATEAPATEAPTEEPTPVPTPPPTNRVGGWLDSITMTVATTDSVITQLEAGDIDIYASTLGRAEDFKAAQEAGLKTAASFGGYYELTFNPAGPEFTDGRLNPFADAKIREAMNWLVDRNYIVQEIYGGLAKPKYLPITGAFPDYAKFIDVVRELENKYAYNPEKAAEVINAEMENLGAVKDDDGKWTYNGEPVTVIFLIRNDGDGTRKPIGDYVSNQLEDLGFTVDRQYKTSSEAAPIWIFSDPAEGQWHIYTGGWITTAVSRDQGGNFLFFYSPNSAYGFTPLWGAYQPSEDFENVAEALDRNTFATLDERADLFKEALRLALEDSARVWLVDQQAFSPYRPEVEVTADLAGGVQGAQLWPFTLRFADQEGGDMKWAMSDLLVEPWNPVAGSNWVYDTAAIRATNDAGFMTDPFTGLVWPQRAERADVFVQKGLPVGKTLDWVNLAFVDEIQVPEDAWVDWDAENQVFITAGEKYPDGLTALRKSIVYYPANFWDTVKWHDGSPITPADIVMSLIMTFDPGMEASAIYDESQAGNLEVFMSTFKGFKIDSWDPFVAEYYSDSYALDAELNVASFWPGYSQGDAKWDVIAIGNLAEANGELAWSADKAEANEVEETSLVGGPSLEILAKYLDQAIADSYIPYEPTLGQYVTPEEAAARYENLKAFYEEHGHFWVGTGPYILDKVYPTEKTLTLVHNPDYPDKADKWAQFAEPRIAEAEVDGDGNVVVGGEATFDVYVTFKDAAYPANQIDSVKYLVFNAEGALAASGDAEMVADGQYVINLSADQTANLTEGASKIEVVVVSKLVSIPTIVDFEFVATK